MPEITAEYLASQGLSETFPERFWKKVRKTKTCWIWTGAKYIGYGRICRGVGIGNISAYVASWILSKGPVPKGLHVLHNCPGGDNPSCVNPHHLWLGTQGDNNRDRSAKGRNGWKARRGEMSNWHKLSIKQVRKIRANELGLNQRQTTLHFSAMYHVCPATIWLILKLKTWKE